MKKNLSLIIMIIISVLILVAMSVRDVAAQEVRDGEEPIFEIGFCITPTQDRNAGRDGDPIYGRNFLHIIDNVNAGSIATIRMSGYSFEYVDFGIESFAEDMYIIPEGFGFSWAMNAYEFKDEAELFEVTIHGYTKSVVIPSAFEAWKLYLSGDVDPCPDPWPVPQEYQVFLPVVFGQ
jgi:hypothetical protein